MFYKVEKKVNPVGIGIFGVMVAAAATAAAVFFSKKENREKAKKVIDGVSGSLKKAENKIEEQKKMEKKT